MAEHEGQTGSDGAPAWPDETLRLYLLCLLAEDERLRVDERLLGDQELAERIALVESELTDDYAAGRLNTAEQEAFAKRFLVTEDRRRQLRFTSALQDYSRSRAAAPVITPRPAPSLRERIAGFFSPNRPGWAIAGSFAVLVLLVGLVWFIASQLRDSTPLIAKQESPTPVLLSPARSQDSVPHEASAPTPQPTPSRKPEAIPSPADQRVTIASFVLLPGGARGGGELARVAVPGGKRDVVRLTLELENATAAGSYQAELANAEGHAVSVPGKLTTEAGNRVVYAIPARLLHSGDYQIKLSRTNASGQTETVGRYYFRALKN